MDFVERFFGISPDGGSGLYEAMLFVGVLGTITAVVLLRRRSRRRG